MNCDNISWPNHSKPKKEKQIASADNTEQKSPRNRKRVGTTLLIGLAPRRRFPPDNQHSGSQSNIKSEAGSRGLKRFYKPWECEHQGIMIPVGKPRGMQQRIADPEEEISVGRPRGKNIDRTENPISVRCKIWKFMRYLKINDA
jgi:hypothetical protein